MHAPASLFVHTPACPRSPASWPASWPSQLASQLAGQPGPWAEQWANDRANHLASHCTSQCASQRASRFANELANWPTTLPASAAGPASGPASLPSDGFCRLATPPCEPSWRYSWPGQWPKNRRANQRASRLSRQPDSNQPHIATTLGFFGPAFQWLFCKNLWPDVIMEGPHVGFARRWRTPLGLHAMRLGRGSPTGVWSPNWVTVVCGWFGLVILGNICRRWHWRYINFFQKNYQTIGDP